MDDSERRGPTADEGDDRRARERRESSGGELRDADEGSYTARPSEEHPEEGGSTRDEDDEAVERTGSDD